ncbi:MAG: hypothetical protein OXC62_16225 [Aestuariivita sp.]|nr:hypothetical protein [Aestuariivita sp.]
MRLSVNLSKIQARSDLKESGHRTYGLELISVEDGLKPRTANAQIAVLWMFYEHIRNSSEKVEGLLKCRSAEELLYPISVQDIRRLSDKMHNLCY